MTRPLSQWNSTDIAQHVLSDTSMLHPASLDRPRWVTPAMLAVVALLVVAMACVVEVA